MNSVFYISAIIAVLATLLAVTRRNAVHALLYLIASLLALALVFYVLGAPFVAALEVIIYAGAIMVLFIFVVMLLNLGSPSGGPERDWLHGSMWIGPGLLCGALLAELLFVFAGKTGRMPAHQVVGSKAVGIALYGPYLLGVELASMVLLAGLVGATHLGRRTLPEPSMKGGS